MDTTHLIGYKALLPLQETHPTNRISEFQSEFIALVHGASVKYAYVAAEIASETAVWGYKEIRRRQCYWMDKKKLLERIIRTMNISLWQKHKDKKYEAGLFVDGVCCIIGRKSVWVSVFGDATVLEIRKNGEERIMGMLNQEGYVSTEKLGQDRYHFPLTISGFPFEQGDTFICATGKEASKSIRELSSYQMKSDAPKSRTTTAGGILILEYGK